MRYTGRDYGPDDYFDWPDQQDPPWRPWKFWLVYTALGVGSGLFWLVVIVGALQWWRG